jgi:hypothetical protein
MAHVLHCPLAPCTQLYNRSCSNKYTPIKHIDHDIFTCSKMLIPVNIQRNFGFLHAMIQLGITMNKNQIPRLHGSKRNILQALIPILSGSPALPLARCYHTKPTPTTTEFSCVYTRLSSAYRNRSPSHRWIWTIYVCGWYMLKVYRVKRYAK